MELNVNTAQYRPNFGMAIRTNEIVSEVLKNRIKNDKDAKKLINLIKKSKENDVVDINLFTDGKSISANIYDTSNSANSFFESHRENIFTKLFEGPVGFIERMQKIADKQAETIKAERKMARAIEEALKEQ